MSKIDVTITACQRSGLSLQAVPERCSAVGELELGEQREDPSGAGDGF
jgi:hypothetical protein